MTQLKLLPLFLLIEFLPCLDIQQCVNISIWLAECLGEFVHNIKSRRRSTHQWANSMVRRPKRALKIKCFKWSLKLSLFAVMHCLLNMNAAITFNCSLLLALYWYCECSWVIYAVKHEFVYTGVWLVYVSINAKLHLCCMFVCQLMLIYILYVFVLALGRESGWLLPTCWQLCTESWRHHHHSTGPSPRYIPRRAVLYCPGNDERKLRKLASLNVDCAVLDCEDGVAVSKKVHEYSFDDWNAASYE